MSGEKVPYHLRQNKYVDRQLFIDVLSHINRVNPIREYLYVSFGGAYLEDFKVLHSNFGNTKMLSLEKEPWVFDRQIFNIPYGCVDCVNLSSDKFLEEFDDFIAEYGMPNILIWLDYAKADQLRVQLNEFQTSIQHCRPYDVVKITVNANPATMGERQTTSPPETAEQLRTRRFDNLKLKLGDYLPSDIGPSDMETQAYAVAILRSIKAAALRGIEGSANLFVQPLTAFVYQDAFHQMLTATCIVLDESDANQFLDHSGLRNYEFSTVSWDKPIKIDVPYLSVREKLYLDNLLFKGTRKHDRSRLKSSTALKVNLAKDPKDTREMVRQYLLFYRYYPHYHRVQY